MLDWRFGMNHALLRLDEHMVGRGRNSINEEANKVRTQWAHHQSRHRSVVSPTGSITAKSEHRTCLISVFQLSWLGWACTMLGQSNGHAKRMMRLGQHPWKDECTPIENREHNSDDAVVRTCPPRSRHRPVPSPVRSRHRISSLPVIADESDDSTDEEEKAIDEMLFIRHPKSKKPSRGVSKQRGVCLQTRRGGSRFKAACGPDGRQGLVRQVRSRNRFGPTTVTSVPSPSGSITAKVSSQLRILLLHFCTGHGISERKWHLQKTLARSLLCKAGAP